MIRIMMCALITTMTTLMITRCFWLVNWENPCSYMSATPTLRWSAFSKGDQDDHCGDVVIMMIMVSFKISDVDDHHRFVVSILER